MLYTDNRNMNQQDTPKDYWRYVQHCYTLLFETYEAVAPDSGPTCPVNPHGSVSCMESRRVRLRCFRSQSFDIICAVADAKISKDVIKGDRAATGVEKCERIRNYSCRLKVRIFRSGIIS